MAVFTSGINGINMLSNFFSFGSITNETVSASEIDATYSSGMKVALYGTYSVNSNGTTISGGTVTGWSTFNASGQLVFSITGINADVQTIATDEQLGLYSSITALFLPKGSTYYGSTNAAASDVLSGFGNDTFIGGAATELFEPAAGTNSITGGTGANTVQFVGSFSSYSIVNNGGGAITVTDSLITRNGVDHISGVQTLKFFDVSATVLANGELQMPTTTVYQATQWANVSDVGSLSVNDSGVNIVNGLSSLESLATSGKLSAISLSASGVTTLNLTAAQVTTDAAALKLITGSTIIDVSAAAANTSFAGPGGPAVVAVFSDPAADYQIVATGNGGVTVVDTGTGRSSADHFANITALQFSDQTVIVATAPASNSVTSGNITELYGAAFGREPDPSGLAYYQAVATANPSLPLTTYAQWFLASPEYTGKHSYAQTTAGDTQFINDLYTGLLHRAPESGAVPYYLGIISKITGTYTAGTTAYAAEEFSAHAVVMTDISQSQEFLNNVQISGQGASTQHWLLVS